MDGRRGERSWWSLTPQARTVLSREVKVPANKKGCSAFQVPESGSLGAWRVRGARAAASRRRWRPLRHQSRRGSRSAPPRRTGRGGHVAPRTVDRPAVSPDRRPEAHAERAASASSSAPRRLTLPPPACSIASATRCRYRRRSRPVRTRGEASRGSSWTRRSRRSPPATTPSR